MDQLGPRKVVPLGAAWSASARCCSRPAIPPLASIGRFMQGAGRRLRADRRRLSRHHLLSGLARRDPDRRDPDVRHGGRIGRPVRGRPVDRGRTSVGPVLAAHGRDRRRRSLFCCSSSSRARSAPGSRHRREPGCGAALRAMGAVFTQSAVDPLRADRRPDLHSDDHLRHGVGRALPAGSARPALYGGGPALGRRCRSAGSSAARCWAGSADRIGRRKPVIIGAALLLLGCLALILFAPAGHCSRPYTLGLIAGIASGAAMIPYTVIKEANRPEHSGTATGVINFLNFSMTALLGPLFASRLMARERRRGRANSATTSRRSAAALRRRPRDLLTFCLRETGPAGANAAPRPEPS